MGSPVDFSTNDAIQLISMAVNQSIARELSACTLLARRDCFFAGLLLKIGKGSRCTYFKAKVDTVYVYAALTYELG